MQGSTTPVAASFPWHPTLTFLWSVPVLWLPSGLGPGYPSVSLLCAVPAWIRGGRWPSIHPIQRWSLGFPGGARDPSHLSVVQTVMPLIKVTWAPSFELQCYDSARLHVFAEGFSRRLSVSGSIAVGNFRQQLFPKCGKITLLFLLEVS